jgi:hypothetical protein
MVLRFLVLLLALVLPAAAGSDSLADAAAGDSLPAGTMPAAIMNEATGAIMGGAVCAAVFGFLMDKLADPSTEVWKTFGGTVVGGAMGYPLFCGLGAYFGGRMSGEHGQLLPAMVGALAATPVALTAAWCAKLTEEDGLHSPRSTWLYVAAALLPPAGAVVGYNWSAKDRPAAGNGAFRIEAPAVGLRPAPDSDARVAINLQFVNVRF